MSDLDKRLVQYFRTVIDTTSDPVQRAAAYEAIDDLVGWQ